MSNKLKRKDLHGPKKETVKERMARERRERDTGGSASESRHLAAYICEALRETGREPISESSEKFMGEVLRDVAGIYLYMHRQGIGAIRQSRRVEAAKGETKFPYRNSQLMEKLERKRHREASWTLTKSGWRAVRP